jgi:hypothetical protein
MLDDFRNWQSVKAPQLFATRDRRVGVSGRRRLTCEDCVALQDHLANLVEVLLDYLSHLFAHASPQNQEPARCRHDYAEEPCVSNTSLDHFDVRPVTWRLGKRRVAGDDRRIKRLC